MSETKVESFSVLTAPLSQVTLLEASAGTGKTFSIKHLVLRLIVEEGIAIDHMLVMTFTTAATAELASRIEEHLRAMRNVLAGRTVGVDPLLLDQLALWDKKGLERSVMAERIATSIAKMDQAHISTIHSFCRDVLQNAAFSAGESLRANLVDDESSLMQQVVNDFLLKAMQSPHEALPNFAQQDALVDLLKALVSSPRELTPVQFVEEPGSDLRALFEAFVEWAPQRLAELKREADQYSFDDMLYDTWRAVNNPDEAIRAQLIARTREAFQAVLVDEFQDTDAEQLDIIEQLFFEPRAEAPQPDAVRYALKPRHEGGAWKALAIGSLFFVGDPKQAIYRFRGADLNVYLRLRSRIDGSCVSQLSTNFRSAAPLVEALNALYDPQTIENGKTVSALKGSLFLNPELTYQRVSPHKRTPELFRFEEGSWSVAPAVEGWFSMDMKVNADTEHDAFIAHVVEMIHEGRDGTLWLACSEAEQETVPEGEWLAPGERPALRRVRAGDIAILCRTNEIVNQCAASLQSYGVSVQRVQKDSVFATREAREVWYVLLAVLANGEEGAMKLALITRLFGVSTQALEQMDEHQKSAWRTTFIDALRTWRHQGVASAFRDLFSQLNVTERLLPLLDGAELLTNYEQLLEILHELGERYQTPEGLVKQYERLLAEPSSAYPPRQASNRDLVRLITMHSSKGLEFPIVCVRSLIGMAPPATSKTKKFVDSLITKNAKGESTRNLLVGDDLKSKSDELQREIDEDAARLIYVALTRARSALRFSGRAQLTTAGAWHGNTPKYLFWKMIGNGYLGYLPSKTDRDALEGVLRAWVNTSGDQVALRPLFLDTRPDPVSPEVSPGTVATLALGSTRREAVKPAWQNLSFTGLTRQVVEPGSYPRYHGRADLGQAEPNDELKAFPRGAQPGECLHAIFEDANFALHARSDERGERERDKLVSAKLRIFLALDDEAFDCARESAQQMLFNVLNATLLPGFSLSELSPKQKTSEMPFMIHTADGVTIEGLKALLRRMGPDYALETLTGESLTGFLTGFMDLVFEHNGQYWVLDWKSNVCGATRRSDFTPEVIAAEMSKHHYRLQYVIYTIALRRFLRMRLREKYRETMLGGALYVFLRGVGPENLKPDGYPGGIVKDEAYLPAIPILDAYLAGDMTLNEALERMDALATQEKDNDNA